jgi:hypothetical protein
MRLQELAGPSLQPISLEARRAFIMAKYLPLLQDQVGAARMRRLARPLGCRPGGAGVGNSAAAAC